MMGHPTFVIIVTAGEELFAQDSVVLIYPGELEGFQVEDIKKPPTVGSAVAPDLIFVTNITDVQKSEIHMACV